MLDVTFPYLDGFPIACWLRDGNHRVPVIFLTAKDATEDKVAGLALADDYVTKPFSLAEIVARVQTVLRRTRGDVDGPMRFADLTFYEENVGLAVAWLGRADRADAHRVRNVLVPRC